MNLITLLIVIWTAYKDFVSDKAANAALAVSERKRWQAPLMGLAALA